MGNYFAEFGVPDTTYEKYLQYEKAWFVQIYQNRNGAYIVEGTHWKLAGIITVKRRSLDEALLEFFRRADKAVVEPWKKAFPAGIKEAIENATKRF